MINAKALVNRHAIAVTHKKATGGGYDSTTGNYVAPTVTDVADKAAIFTLTRDDLLQIDGGEVTADDKKAYTNSKWKVGEKIVIGTVSYLVVAELKNYDTIVDFYIYHIKREGASA